jgi:hypothetical protein
MANTFRKFSWFWKIYKRDDQACSVVAVHLPDLQADVCSPQDTSSALMPSIPRALLDWQPMCLGMR